MKNKLAKNLLEEAADNAKYDRDIAKEFLEVYRKEGNTKLTKEDVNYSSNLSKIFEALSRSNDQIIKAAAEISKIEKNDSKEEDEIEDLDMIFDRFEEVQEKEG